MQKNRKDLILKMRKKGMTYTEIAIKFSISWQRAWQIANEYKSKAVYPLRHKIWTSKKRNLLGLSDKKFTEKDFSGDGRNRIRELVRIRDKHTCQICRKRWIKGKRRFDVHHLSRKMDGKSRSHGVINYDKNNMDKLITLCHKCHFNLDITKKRISLKSSPVKKLYT